LIYLAFDKLEVLLDLLSMSEMSDFILLNAFYNGSLSKDTIRFPMLNATHGYYCTRQLPRGSPVKGEHICNKAKNIILNPRAHSLSLKILSHHCVATFKILSWFTILCCIFVHLYIFCLHLVAKGNKKSTQKMVIIFVVLNSLVQ